MAITKVYAIRSRLDTRVSYVVSKSKTSLDGAIDYAANPDKTEQSLFESVLNCLSTDTAYEDMQGTKRRFKKTDGVLGYHFIQSFAPGEVSPQQAHDIGREFAKCCFGDRFEVLIGTHLDKHHLHNHLIINSVSFVDGKKYHSSPDSYYNIIRGTSDKLCQENSLSVVKPKGRGQNHAEWKAEKGGKPTIRSQVRADIDGIIAQSLNLSTFIALLKKSGYEVKYGDVKHTAIRPPYSQRYIRLDSLGEDYSDANLEMRMAKQGTWKKAIRLPEGARHFRCRGSIKNAPKITGFTALYFRYVYLLRGAMTNRGNHKVSRYLLEDTIKYDRIVAQHRFLAQNNIKTLPELQAVKSSLRGQTAQCPNNIKRLRHDLRLCEQIEKDVARVQQRTKEAQTMLNQKEQKHSIRKQAIRMSENR